jgi:hypothetical protein
MFIGNKAQTLSDYPRIQVSPVLKLVALPVVGRTLFPLILAICLCKVSRGKHRIRLAKPQQRTQAVQA